MQFKNTFTVTTKLTLTIEKDVIQAAKSYAQKRGSSLSDLVENYLKTLAIKNTQSEELSPRVERLVRAVKLPSNFDYKQALEIGIQKKHGK